MKRDQINRAILPLAVAGIEVDMVQMSPIAFTTTSASTSSRAAVRRTRSSCSTSAPTTPT